MSKKQKLTPWFPVRIKPARKGLYQALYPECPDHIKYRYWNGKDWTIDKESLGGTLFGCFANDKWRGLAKEPK